RLHKSKRRSAAKHLFPYWLRAQNIEIRLALSNPSNRAVPGRQEQGPALVRHVIPDFTESPWQRNLAQDALRVRQRRRTRTASTENPQGQILRDLALPLDRRHPVARRQRRLGGQLDRFRDFRRQGPREIYRSLGHDAADYKRQRRRNRRLRQGEMEDRQRELQRDEKSRLRAR